MKNEREGAKRGGESRGSETAFTSRPVAAPHNVEAKSMTKQEANQVVERVARIVGSVHALPRAEALAQVAEWVALTYEREQRLALDPGTPVIPHEIGQKARAALARAEALEALLPLVEAIHNPQRCMGPTQLLALRAALRRVREAS